MEGCLNLKNGYVRGRVGYALAGITPLRTVLALFTHTALHNSIHFK